VAQQMCQAVLSVVGDELTVSQVAQKLGVVATESAHRADPL